MKKLTSLLLLVLVALSPLISLAEKQPAFTAADYVSLSELSKQVVDGWHETYTAHGREVIANADVAWMPETDVCPIVQIEQASWEGSDSLLEKYRDYRDSLVYVNGTLSILVLEESEYCEKDGENYRGRTILDQDLVYKNGEKPTQDAEGCDLTYDGFLGWIDEVTEPLCGMKLEGFKTTYVHVWGIYYKAKERNGELIRGTQWTKTGGYSLSAYQMFHGIPVLHSYGQNMPYIMIGYNYLSPKRFSINISYGREVAVPIADVPLLSFGAMKRVWEAQIEAGNLRGIDELEFGYQIFYQGEGANRRWLLIPVWRILGGYTRKANSDKNVMPYYDPRNKDGSVTVPMEYNDYYYNAQTGEMIQTTKVTGGENHGPLPVGKILTWDDVNGKR